MVWYLAEDVGSEDLGEVEASAQAAFDTWSAVSCSGLHFSYGGTVADARFGEADGRNVVFYLETWPGESALLSEPSITLDGDTLIDVDVAINAQDYGWSALEGDGIRLMDLQGAITHEAGHLAGLWHSTVEGATLNPNMDGHPDARSLEGDDIEGICTLYSQESLSGGEVGDTCTETPDCAEDLVCLADGEDRYCSQTCDSPTDCEAGYECLDVGDMKVCAREVEGCGCHSREERSGPAGWMVWSGLLLFWRRRGR